VQRQNYTACNVKLIFPAAERCRPLTGTRLYFLMTGTWCEQLMNFAYRFVTW